MKPEKFLNQYGSILIIKSVTAVDRVTPFNGNDARAKARAM
jgi:hypothetical protein